MREKLLFYVRTDDKIALTVLISFNYSMFSCVDRLQNDTDENIQTIPTIGFNVEVLQYKNIKFQVKQFL